MHKLTAQIMGLRWTHHLFSIGSLQSDCGAADRQRPEVLDAAIAVAGVAPRDRQARDGHRLPGLDLEYAVENQVLA